MCADIPESETTSPRPARVAFRSRPVQPTAPAPSAPEAPAGLAFTPTASAHGSDRDILMGYQIFLGRDPENSFVINEAKSSPLRGFLGGLILSGEFETAVLQPLARRAAMPHDRSSLGPAPEQIGWLTGLVTLPPDIAEGIAGVPDWRSFWTTLTAMPGFPRGGQAAAPAGMAPAAASQGFVLITIEQPRPGDKLLPGSTLNGSGWAIAPEDIAEIAVMLDGVTLGQARHGLPRPDVARNFPHYRHVDHCGFAFSASLPRDAAITPQSQLGIMVRTVGGQTGRRGVRVTGPVQAAPPALPLRLTVDDVRIDDGGYLRLRGWALSRAGTASVTVFLGGTPLGEAEYGLDRPGLAGTYSDYPNAGSSGFVFGASVAGKLDGPASVRVQVSDTTGEQRQVIVPVSPPAPGGAGRAPAPGDAASTLERFQCDDAVIGPDGRVTISGWACPDDGVQDMAVLRAGKSVASPIHGSARPDIAQRFPGLPDAARSGFKCTFSPNPAAQPGDLLTLRLRTSAGRTVTLEVPLTTSRPDTARPPLPAAGADLAPAGTRLMVEVPALDGAQAAEKLRGAVTINGWAVAPAGIAEVAVSCDGRQLGLAYCGERREDLARTFPDYVDAHRGGFALVLAPGTVAPGLRRFTVTARSRDGDTQSTSFSAEVEASEDAWPGSAPRLTMPRTEQAMMRGILAAQSCHPAFTVIVQAGPEAETHATLASLARQAYPASAISLQDTQAAAAFPTLAGCFAPLPRPAAKARPQARSRPPSKKAPPRDAAADIPNLIMVLQAGDVLGCDALLELAVVHAMNRDAGFIYADEQRFDPVHARPAPFHKPAWSPELLLNMDYIGRPWCATQAAMDAAGLTEADLTAQPGYATVLRLTAAAGRIVHTDKVLATTGSATGADTAAACLAAEIGRRGLAATVDAGPVAGTWRLRRSAAFGGLVSVIMPTAGRGGLVKRAIDSVRATTAPGMIEIVVLENVAADDGATRDWLHAHADRVIAMAGPFNWSRCNNVGVAAARGDMLLFLNDDIEARQPGWLEALLEHATRPEIGVTGARLLYPDGKVQHGGVFLSETAGRHAFRFAAGDDAGPFGLARVSRDMSVVTGACQMVRREVFDRLGGFDEAHDVINNDVDFCLRARQAGLSVIFTPHAELIHHELASRALIEDRFDADRFTGDWRLTMLQGDPFHSRRLREFTDYDEPDQEPVTAIHAGPRGPELTAIQRILAVKLDHIGDFLTAVPALQALRLRFPGARITLLAPQASALLARGGEYIDDVIEFAFFHSRSAEGLKHLSDQDYADLATRLQPHRFDMAIDLRMHPETRPVLRHTGAPFLVGYDRNGSYPWLDVRLEWEGDERLHAKPGHITERLLALVEAAWLACRPVDPPVLPAVADAAGIAPLARLPADFLAKRMVCIHPGLGNPMRRWPAAHFGALIDLLGAEEDMHALLVGGPEEQQFAREVLAETDAQHRVVSLAGTLTLAELGEVMRACVLFVGNDSGPKHLAASLGVPTLGVHSAVVDAAEWAPLGSAAFALERRVVCGPCYLALESECPRGRVCLTGLKPRDALAACRRLLALRPRAG